MFALGIALKKNKEGYEEVSKYFSLCNFNPFELIYHFIKLLEIQPIHSGFENVDNLPKEIQECQITRNEKNVKFRQLSKC